LYPVVRDTRKSVAKELVENVRGELCDTTIEQQVEFRNEKTTEESINNQLHLFVESKQDVDNPTVDKLDQSHTHTDYNIETVESDTCGVRVVRLKILMLYTKLMMSSLSK
ncbi:hypothetical protein Tco_0221777, partial [Tanacetum coccineum]